MKLKLTAILLPFVCASFVWAVEPAPALVVCTEWRLLQDFNQKEVRQYLDSCAKRGCNAVKITVLNELSDINVYDDKALKNNDLTKPQVTNGSDFADYVQYDYWDNVEWVIDELARRKMLAVIVPLSNCLIAEKHFPKSEIRLYMNLLCRRLAKRKNIIWALNSDLTTEIFTEKKDIFLSAWHEMEKTIQLYNPKHTIIIENESE